MSSHSFEHPCFSLEQKVQECTRLVYKKLIYLRQLQQNMSLFLFPFSLKVFFQSPRNEFPCPSSSHFPGLHHLRRRASWGLGNAGVRFLCHWLIIYIEHSILNLLINFFGCVNKCLFYICCCFGRGLHEDQAMFPGKSLPLLFFHVSSCL